MRRRFPSLPLLLTLAAVAGLTPTGTARAAWDPERFGVMEWRMIGPFRGGRVTTAVGVPGQPLVYYQGATGGGVWKTDDAGNSWRNVSDGFFGTGSVGALAVAPSNPDVVYAGMGEVCLRSNFSHGDGVYRSDDAGRSWSHVGLELSRHVGAILVHPSDPLRVWVAALGSPFGPSEERGVFRSTDGGAHWERVLFVDADTGGVDLSADPRDPNVIYAGLWQVRRQPWGMFSGGPGSGLYKTADGGDTWQELAGGLPAGDKGRIGVAVSPVDSKRVWALVEAEDGGLYRSDDAGASWSLINDDFHLRRRHYYYTHVYADPAERDTVYVLTSPFMKSVDGGASFEFVRVPHGDNHDLWIAPEDNRRMINANDGGANVSFDGGRSWSRIDNQPTAQFYWVTTDNQFPYHVYGAQQDNSTVAIASRTEDQGITEEDWYTVGGGESGYIAPHPDDPNIVYAGSFWGVLTRFDRRTGESRSVTPGPVMPMGRTGAELSYRFPWTFPIVFSPHDHDTLYSSAQVLFRTRDEGRSWDVISPDLTRDEKPKQIYGRLTDFYNTISSVAPSPLERGLIWVGSDDGLIHLTRDEGGSWQDVTPGDRARTSRVNLIEASPHAAGTAWAAVNRYMLDDFRPYIYRTRDYGASWELITDGIPADDFVRVVREDPEQPGLLYAGTETSVYVSFDAGQRWQPLQLNLPRVPITDLAVKQGDLVASTQGRAFWILDDLEPLRRAPQLGSEPVALIPPRAATRSFRSRGGGGYPAGVGKNPPEGVVIHYWLNEAPPQQPVLEILDASGALVQRFDQPPREERGVDGKGVPTRFARRIPGVTSQPGLNRFAWDMRYPDAAALEGRSTYLFGAGLSGPVAVPGSYQVRLRIGDRTLTEGFEIRKDPRLRASVEDLQAQFDLLVRIRDGVSEAHQGVNQILTMQERVAAVSAESKAADLKRRLAALDAALSEVRGELIELRFTGIDDQMLVFALKLNARMGSLQRVVAGAEARPTAQAYAAVQELELLLSAQLERLSGLAERDVTALDRELRSRGLNPIRDH